MTHAKTRRSTDGPIASSDRSELTRRGLLKTGGALTLAGAALPLLGRGASATRRQGAVQITVTDSPAEEATDVEKEAYTALVERFKSVRPDVTIESTAGGYGGPEAFAAKVAGGTLENAFAVWYTEPQRIIEQGIAADITDQLNAWENFSAISPDALAVVSDASDRIFGIPISQYALSLAYNRRLFEEAGLDPNTPPATWEEARTAAKTLADSTESAGFAFLSTENQGGWHFVTVLFTFGADPVEEQGGKYVATFNSPEGVEVLQLLKEMRWTDQSMTEEQLLNQAKMAEFLATDQTAMGIAGIPTELAQYGADINNYGLGIVPQSGGNATLGGGYAWMFNADSSPEQIQAAIDWVLFRYFDPQNYEASLQANLANNQPVGFPEPPVLTGPMQEERNAILTRLANVPTEFYTPYVEGMQQVQIRPEPAAIDVQKLYAALDPVVQAVLTDQNADPKTLLDEAATTFQTTVLDAS